MKSYNIKNTMTKVIDILKNPEFASGSIMILVPEFLKRPPTGNYIIDTAIYSVAYAGGLGLMLDGGMRWLEKRDKAYLEKRFTPQ
ncbi:hypothetical protein A3K64_02945 [Candidatus Micrarchaeota archaeon RBG_16_36_9]|nr:MAG: hypothetical protein A3K64_02945 [Candidatus Micrarchaeota archaeon RBG_16_36_9]